VALALGNTDAVLIATTTNPVLAAFGSTEMLFLKVTACNNDTGAHQVTVYRVPLGGSPATGEILVNAMNIGAGQTSVLPLSGQSLVNSQELFAKADAANVVNLNIGWATL